MPVQPLRCPPEHHYKPFPGEMRCASHATEWAKNMFVRACGLAIAGFLLASCAGGNVVENDDSSGSTSISSSSQRVTLGVNSYLWHATLDALSFMPLQSADPFGGVIITDWYSSPGAANDRMRVTVYILDRRLRADGIKVAVFRQTHSDAGWADAQVNPETANKLEDAILARARELRLASGGT